MRETPGLPAAVRRLGVGDKAEPAVVAAAVELVLEGLHLARRVNKDRSGAETIYRRLMVCLREEGNPSGVLTAYRRCRELLSIVLGRAPSPETEAVRQSL